MGKHELPSGSDAILSIRPEKLRLHAQGAQVEAGRATLAGEIISLVYLGTDTRYVVKVAGNTEVVVRMQNDMSLGKAFRTGEKVILSWLPQHGRVMEIE